MFQGLNFSSSQRVAAMVSLNMWVQWIPSVLSFHVGTSIKKFIEAPEAAAAALINFSTHPSVCMFQLLFSS